MAHSVATLVAAMELLPSRAVIHRYEIEKGGELDPAQLRTDMSCIYAHQGYIYTPPGKSSRRYVVEFPRPAPAAEPFNLFLHRAAHGKIRFDGFRIEAKKKESAR